MRSYWFQLVAAGLVLAACGEGGEAGSIGPRDSVPPPASGALLSAPIPRALVPLPGPGGASLVFVAAAPATVPRAARAVARTASGDSALAFVTDGGFDPVAIAAAEGDGITVQVVDSAGDSTVVQLLAARRPPRVVRTTPQPRSTDVPLNSRVTVVFSAPMDASAVGAGMRVEHRGQPVPGTVRLAPNGLSAEFEPAATLDAQSDYELAIDPDVRDVLGTQLGEPVRVPFRTGGEVIDIDRIRLTMASPRCWGECPSDDVVVGEPIELQARAGYEWARGFVGWREVPTQWSVSAGAPLRLVELSPGTVRVEALAGGGQAVVTATVAPGISRFVVLNTFAGLPADAMSTRVWYAPDNGAGSGSWGVWTERLDGTGREQLFALSELPAEFDVAPQVTNDCNEPHGFALSRTGRLAVTVASVSRVDHRGGVWIKDGPGGPLRRVTPAADSGSANFPAWSSDGRQLAYWFDDMDERMTELRVVEADGSGQRVLERVPFDTLESFTMPDFGTCPLAYIRPLGGVPIVWHPDGRRVLKWSGNGTEQVALDGSGSSPYLTGYLAGPWSPDGERQFVYRKSFSPGWPRQLGYFRSGFQAFEASRDGVVGGVDVWGAPLAVSPDGRLQVVQGFDVFSAIATPDRNAVRRLQRQVRGFVY